jgi:hypothetical protein
MSDKLKLEPVTGLGTYLGRKVKVIKGDCKDCMFILPNGICGFEGSECAIDDWESIIVRDEEPVSTEDPTALILDLRYQLKKEQDQNIDLKNQVSNLLAIISELKKTCDKLLNE